MAELKNLGGRPAIYIDGKFYPPMMATIRTNNIDHMCIDREYYRNLGKAGIKIFFVICDTVWLKPNAIELFKEEAEIILEEVPDAYIIPRMGLHPTNEWIKENPEECVTFSDGSQVPYKNFFTESYVTDIPALYSLCSKKWREDAGKALEETWKILMSLPYADRIVGYHLCGGITQEWMHHDLYSSFTTITRRRSILGNRGGGLLGLGDPIFFCCRCCCTALGDCGNGILTYR